MGLVSIGEHGDNLWDVSRERKEDGETWKHGVPEILAMKGDHFQGPVALLPH